MSKFRVKLTDGRVVGPFNDDEILELIKKKHVALDSKFQKFPVGNWLNGHDLEEVRLIFENIKNNEQTFIKKIKELEDKNSDLVSKKTTLPATEEDFPKEFKYHSDATSNVKTFLQETSQANKTSDNDQSDKTIIRNLSVKDDTTYEKTIISKDTLEHIKKLEKNNEFDNENDGAGEQASEIGLAEEPPFDENVLMTEGTEMISLDDLRKTIGTQIRSSEKDLENEEKEFIKNRDEENREESDKKGKGPDSVEKESFDDNIVERKTKRKKLVFALIALLMGLLFFMDEDKPKTEIVERITYPKIIFPQQYDIPDEDKATALYREGMLKLAQGNFVSTMDAAEFFRASVENKFRDNNATGRLIFVYAELLQHSGDVERDVGALFKLVQVFNTKMMDDPYLSAGIANFYLRTGKIDAVINLVEKFITLKKSSPSKELFAVYMNALLEKGDIVKAKKIKDLFDEDDLKNYYVAKALINYYSANNEKDLQLKSIQKAISNFSESVELTLMRADLLYERSLLEKVKTDLDFVSERSAYGSKIFYSKYYELKGLLLAQEGEAPEVVLKSFERALSYNESTELRTKLAMLDSNSTDAINRLINHSKAIRLIENSKGHLVKNNYKFAFRDALEATRVAPEYVPARLHLVNLQLRQSYYEQALKNLEDLYEKDPQNPEIIFALIDGYISAYRFEKAKSLLSVIGSTDLRTKADYYAKTAKYYIYRDQIGSAISWLQKAISIDPLSDELNYELAKILIRHKQFNQAKVVLNKVMDIDPANVDYRISYAEILYETENANSAIGYLYNVLEDFKDNPKILSSIGIYYYRTGQLKMFQSIKEKLESLSSKDGTLFEFLINAAKMDQKYEKIIEYSKELIDINPGNLEARLYLGRVYMDQSMYKEALVQFDEIKSRLESYPKVQYYISKLYLLTDNIDKAIDLAQKEIEGNPSSVDGYVLLGEIYVKQEKYNEAEEQYKKAQKINERNVDVLNGLALINFKKSQYEIALDLYKKSKKFEPSLAETYRLLGDVYRKIGQSSLAIEEYEMYLELSPNTRYKENLQNYIRMMK